MPCARSLRGRHRADAPQRVDVELAQEVLHALRRDHGEPVGLLPARGDLRQELVGRDAGRRRQAGGGADLRLEAPRDGHAERLAPGVLGDVEIGLVERQRLDQRRDRAEEAEHRVGHRLVLGEVGPDDDQVRAQPHGPRHRNRRPDAELARLVAGGGDHAAAFGPAAHGDGPAAQLRAIALLDRRVERVHVEVQDAPRWRPWAAGSVSGGAETTSRLLAHCRPFRPRSPAAPAARCPGPAGRRAGS